MTCMSRFLRGIQDNQRYKAMLGYTEEAIRERINAHNEKNWKGSILEGVSVGVKDVFHVEGWETRAGTKKLKFEGKEGCLVNNVKQNGGLVIGKTICTEMQFMDSSATLNPWSRVHTPGGSSSGSAAAVALGITDVALGTQTNGSVIRPAAYCATYGFKPSLNRLPRDGFVNFSPSVDQPGFFAATHDLTLLLSQALIDRWDTGVYSRQGKISFGLPHCNYLSLSTRNIGDEPTFSVVTEYLNILENVSEVLVRHKLLTEGEAFRVHKNLWRGNEDIFSVKFNEMMVRGSKVTDMEVESGQASMLALREAVEVCMDRAGVDVLLAPSTVEPCAPLLSDKTTGDPSMNIPWSHAGLPVLNVPLSHRNNAGLPICSVQVVGRHNDDETVLRAALLIPDRM